MSDTYNNRLINSYLDGNGPDESTMEMLGLGTAAAQEKKRREEQKAKEEKEREERIKNNTINLYAQGVGTDESNFERLGLERQGYDTGAIKKYYAPVATAARAQADAALEEWARGERIKNNAIDAYKHGDLNEAEMERLQLGYVVQQEENAKRESEKKKIVTDKSNWERLNLDPSEYKFVDANEPDKMAEVVTYIRKMMGAKEKSKIGNETKTLAGIKYEEAKDEKGSVKYKRVVTGGVGAYVPLYLFHTTDENGKEVTIEATMTEFIKKLQNENINKYNEMHAGLADKYYSVAYDNPDFDEFVLYNQEWRDETGKYFPEDLYWDFNNLTALDRQLYFYYKNKAGQEVADKFFTDVLVDVKKARDAETKAQEAGVIEKYDDLFFGGVAGFFQTAADFVTGNSKYRRNHKYRDYLKNAYINEADGIEKVFLLTTTELGRQAPILLATLGVGNVASLMGASTRVINAFQTGVSLALNANSTYQTTLSNAVYNGKNIESAKTEALLTAGAETATQYFLGGISMYGKSGATRVVEVLGKTKYGAKVLTAASSAAKKLASNPTTLAMLKSTLKLTGDVGSEAFEEFLQEAIIAPIIQSVSYGDELKIDLADPDALYSLAVGGLTALVMNGPGAAVDTDTNVPTLPDISSMGVNQTNPVVSLPGGTNDTSGAPPLPSPVATAGGNRAQDINLPSQNTNALTGQNKGDLDDARIGTKEGQGVENAELNSDKNLEIETKEDYNKEEYPTESNTSNKNNLKTKIRYSSTGIKLPKNEYAKFFESTSTDYHMEYKTHKGLQYQSCVTDDSHILYIYEDGGFGNYNVVARIDYANEDVAKAITEVLDNEEHYEIAGVINEVLKTFAIRQSGYTVYNARTKKRSGARGNGALSERASESYAGGTNGSSGGLSGIKRGNGIEVTPENSQNSAVGLPSPEQLAEAEAQSLPVPLPDENQITDNYSDTSQFLERSPKAQEDTSKKKGKSAFELTDTGAGFRNLGRKNADSNIYQIYDTAKNSDSMAQNHMTRQQHDAYGNVINNGESLVDVLQEYISGSRKKDYGLLQKYMHNLNNEARTAQGKQLLREDMVFTKAEMQKLEAEHPEIVKTAQQIRDYCDNLLQILVDRGVMSAETAQYYRETYPYYIPSHRDMGDTDGVHNPYNDSEGVDNTVKAARGSERDILPLHEQLVSWTNAVFKQTELNAIFNELSNIYENGESNGQIHNIYKRKGDSALPENSIKFYKNGEEYVIEMSELLYNGAKDLMSGMKSKEIKILSNPTKFFKEVTTDKNILFGLIKNPIKDAGTAMINSEYPLRFVGEACRYLGAGSKEVVAKIAHEKITSDPMWDLYNYMGNTENGLIDLDGDSNFFEGKSKFNPLNAIEKANWFVEQIPRFLEFVATIDAESDIRQRLKKGEKLTAADQEVLKRASYNAAKVTTNFKTSGKTVRVLNKNGIPYLNAQTQGLLQHYRNFADAPITAKSKSAVAGRLLLKSTQYMGGAAALALQLALAYANEKEDWYKKISERNKQTYFYFTKDFKIPKSETLMLIDNIKSLFSSRNRTEFWQNLGTLATDTPNPVTQNLLWPFIRAALFEKTYYGTEIVPTYLQKDKNKVDQYTDDTSEIAKWIAQAIAWVTGSENVIGPMPIEDMIYSYTGVIGDTILPMTAKSTYYGMEGKNAFEKAISGAGKAFSAPFLKYFHDDELSMTQITGDFYDAKAKYAETANSTNATLADGFAFDYFSSEDAKLSELKKEKESAEKTGDRTKQLEIKNEMETIQKRITENAERYKACADKVLARPEFKGINMEIPKWEEAAKLAIDYEFGGAEYALSKTNQVTWDEAQKYHAENGISYDTYFKYLTKKTEVEKELAIQNDGKSDTEKKELSDEEKNGIMLKWFLEEVEKGDMDAAQANALASLELKKSFNNTTSYDYDLSSEEALYLSTLSPAQQEKYKYLKEKCRMPDYETFDKLLKAYNSKSRKNEKIAALIEIGCNQAAAVNFYNVMQNKTGYKTTTNLKKISEKYSISPEKTEDLYNAFIMTQHADGSVLAVKRKESVRVFLDAAPKAWHELYDINEATEDIYRILSE